MSDVCLLFEGRYPGGGGVVTWVDSLVRHLPTLSFSVVAFRHPLCGAAPTESVAPENVEQVVDIFLPEDTDPALLAPDELDMLAAAVPDAAVHHVLSVGVASRVAAKVSVNYRRPFLLTEHGIAWREKALGQTMSLPQRVRERQSAAARGAAAHAYRRATAVTSVSRIGAEWQRRLGASPSQVLHVPNPAPHAPEASTAIVPPIDGTGPLVGLVARVVALKDIATFVRAAALIAQQLPSARFVVLGSLHEDEQYVRRCIELARAVGLADRLQFTGEVDAWAWYPSLDVVVLTSRSEAQPFAVLEALSAGRPVVSTSAGDIPHLLADAGPAGAVVPIGDAAAVAEGVLRALDVADHVTVRAQARRVVDRLPTEAQHAATYARLYDWAAGGAKTDFAGEALPSDVGGQGRS